MKINFLDEALEFWNLIGVCRPDAIKGHVGYGEEAIKFFATFYGNEFLVVKNAFVDEFVIGDIVEVGKPYAKQTEFWEINGK